MTGRQRGKMHMELQKNSWKPLLNRSIMGQYPPGSTFKTTQALTFLSEGIIGPSTAFPCSHGFHYYQQSDLVLQLCDSLGLLVWEEIPWCRGGVGGDAYQAQAHRMLENMIRQHRHHPSIILWGLGNENDWPGDFSTEIDTTAVRQLMASLNLYKE